MPKPKKAPSVPGAEERPEREVRLSINLTPEQHAWISTEAKERGISLAEMARLCLQQTREQLALATGPGADASDDSKRAALLKTLRKVGGLYLSAERNGVSARQVRKWMDQEEFREDALWAQKTFLEGIENDLVDLGRGDRKGFGIGLITILNAHHPSYGRVKAEMIRRILDQLLKELVKILEEEFGGGQEETLNRAIERFDNCKEQKLLAFTD